MIKYEFGPFSILEKSIIFKLIKSFKSVNLALEKQKLFEWILKCKKNNPKLRELFIWKMEFEINFQPINGRCYEFSNNYKMFVGQPVWYT